MQDRLRQLQGFDGHQITANQSIQSHLQASQAECKHQLSQVTVYT